MKRALLVLLALPVLAAAGPPKIGKEFDKLSPFAMVDVVVQFNLPAGASQHAVVLRGGGKLKRQFSRALDGAQYTIPVVLAKLLAQSDLVKFVSIDRKLKGAMEYASPAVYADIAYNYGWTGAGIGVAVLDSGITTGTLAHPDLKAAGGTGSVRVVYSESFVDNDASTNDLYGHGEHVAGIIGGNASQSEAGGSTRRFRGIAPGVNIVNLRVLDKDGQGTDSAVIAAIDRAIALKSQYNIRVMNLSLGRPVLESYVTDPLCQAVERAWKAGIAVVVAAGNGGRIDSNGVKGYGTILSPANDPYVITVGAMRDMSTASRADDQLASYSSKGPTAIDHLVKPDLVAPGNMIVSLKPVPGGRLATSTPSPVVPASYYRADAAPGTPSAYMKLSGTSMAAPMVSGAAALLLQKNPALTPDAVKATLMRTASKTFPRMSTYTDPVSGISYTQRYDIFSVGSGYLDVWAALNSTKTVPAGRRAGSLRAFLVPGTGVSVPTTFVLDGTNVIWGGDEDWGSTQVWGSMAFISGTNVIWGGDDSTWGDITGAGGLLWAENVIWGGDESEFFSEALTALGGDK